MKRSEINQIIVEAEAFLEEHKFHLPPWAKWGLSEWKDNIDNVSEITVTDRKGAANATVDTLETIVLPDVPEFIAPIIYALPIQLLAYHTAVFMGTDVDQPRNLAKSVTVE